MQESLASARTTDRYAHRIDVRFHEIDWFGHVSHMWYLAYFDAAREAYFRSRGVPQAVVFLQIVRVEIEWKKASVRRGDHVDVQVRPLRIGNSSFTLEFDVLHGEQRQCAAIGRTVYVCVSADQDGKSSSSSIPPVLREALTGDLS